MLRLTIKLIFTNLMKNIYQESQGRQLKVYIVHNRKALYKAEMY